MVQTNRAVKYIALGILLATQVNADSSPTINLVGGRYYITVDGVKQDGYYTTDHTAKKAATNLAFMCRCEVEIDQAPIRVSASYERDVILVEGTFKTKEDQALLQWTTPTKRQDGSELDPSHIKGYIIDVFDAEQSVMSIEVDGNQRAYILSGINPSTYSFSIRTVDTDGQKSEPSGRVSKTPVDN